MNWELISRRGIGITETEICVGAPRVEIRQALAQHLPQLTNGRRPTEGGNVALKSRLTQTAPQKRPAMLAAKSSGLMTIWVLNVFATHHVHPTLFRPQAAQHGLRWL